MSSIYTHRHLNLNLNLFSTGTVLLLLLSSCKQHKVQGLNDGICSWPSSGDDCTSNCTIADPDCSTSNCTANCTNWINNIAGGGGTSLESCTEGCYCIYDSCDMPVCTKNCTTWGKFTNMSACVENCECVKGECDMTGCKGDDESCKCGVAGTCDGDYDDANQEWWGWKYFGDGSGGRCTAYKGYIDCTSNCVQSGYLCNAPNCEKYCVSTADSTDLPSCTENCECHAPNCDMPLCTKNCLAHAPNTDMRSCTENCEVSMCICTMHYVLCTIYLLFELSLLLWRLLFWSFLH